MQTSGHILSYQVLQRCLPQPECNGGFRKQRGREAEVKAPLEVLT